MPASKLITPHMLHDQPLDPARVPDPVAFYFEDYANTFARRIADRELLPPPVIGISSQWGSRKTALLLLIHAKLDFTQEDSMFKWTFANSDDETTYTRSDGKYRMVLDDRCRGSGGIGRQ